MNADGTVKAVQQDMPFLMAPGTQAWVRAESEVLVVLIILIISKVIKIELSIKAICLQFPGMNLKRAMAVE